jgi:toxin ParE1/3/4
VTEFRISRSASTDIDSIAEYIAQDNPDRAATFIEELYQKLLVVAERPLSFPIREEISPTIRSAHHGKYLIFFKVNAKIIDILRILHGSRDFENLLWELT